MFSFYCIIVWLPGFPSSLPPNSLCSLSLYCMYCMYLYLCLVFTISMFVLLYAFPSSLPLTLSTLSQSLLLQYFPLLFVTQFVYFSSISLLLYLASFFLYPPSSLAHSYICPSFTVSLPLYLLFIFSSFFPHKISFLLETVSFFFLIFFFSESSFLFLSILFSFVLS